MAYAFPKVRLITTAVDREINDQCHIIPGIGKHDFALFKTGITCSGNALTFRDAYSYVILAM